MRLDWVRKNQDKLRMESLQGLMDYVGEQDQRLVIDTPSAATMPSERNVHRKGKGKTKVTAQTFAGLHSVPLPKIGKQNAVQIT